MINAPTSAATEGYSQNPNQASTYRKVSLNFLILLRNLKRQHS